MDNQSLYQANQPYHYAQSDDLRQFMGPPPETIRVDERILLQLPASTERVHFQHHRYGNPLFLSALATSYNLSQQYEILPWNYYNRREAQYILPFLLLGPFSIARDKDFIKETGITMMVAVRNKRAAQLRPSLMEPSKFASAEGLETATFDVETPYDIVTGRYTILKQINDHLEASCRRENGHETDQISGKVLIFCETGNERSPVLPALYLMTIWGLDAYRAIQVIQSRRFGIALSHEMISMLQDVEAILNAERQVAGAVSSTDDDNTRLKPSSKRTIHVTNDSDADRLMDTYRDGQDSTVRAGTAPFRDGVGDSDGKSDGSV